MEITTPTLLLPLLLGFLLDSLLGDPYHWPHPIKVFGNMIGSLEQKYNRGAQRRLHGGLVTGVLVCGTFVVFGLLERVLLMQEGLYVAISSVLVFYGLANHTLIREALKVEHELSKNGLEAGRARVAYIVGRDTSQLSAQQIRTATLETLAENLSDGVVAPLFYYALGGFPAMFAYKMVNTLDSMIGYKSDRYREFGFVAAKLDDVANYIPARLTALAIALVSLRWRGFVFMLRYGHLHASPNSGYPEAALAGVLNCRFGGPNVYHGQLVDKPFIGVNDREVSSKDIHVACRVNALVAILSVMIITCCFYLL